MSVETDVQTRYPEMLYTDVLAKVHEALEERLRALSGAGPSESTIPSNPSAEATSSAGASTSSPPEHDDAHRAFGDSIQNWAVFPDTCDALRRLAKHYKLVVLSNVDRASFRHTHALLAEGPTRATVTSEAGVYTYPDPNPNKFWHPQEAPGSRSPFSLIVTAQDVGCYKPALGGFRAILEYIASQPELFDHIGKTADEVLEKTLSVAQSLPHDHEPAHALGMRSVWIDRQAAVTCNVTPGGPEAKDKWTWRFETLGEMADALEEELAKV